MEKRAGHGYECILYLGDLGESSTPRHRADALKRLVCNVVLVDPSKLIGSRSRWQVFIDYRTAYRLVQPRLLRALCAGLVSRRSSQI
jgi:hypothetical protein